MPLPPPKPVAKPFLATYPMLCDAYSLLCAKSGFGWAKSNGEVFSICAGTPGGTDHIEVHEGGMVVGSCILLRPPNTASKLVIGCGNNPPYEELLELGHEHEDAVTLDPNFMLNPTVVGFFGMNLDVVEAFGGHKFDVIIFEGTPPSGQACIATLKAILNDGGTVWVSEAKGFSKENLDAIVLG